MNDYETLKKIIFLSEVTLSKNKAYINYIEVDYLLISFLILLNILDLESGNFETQETHYRLHFKFIKKENNSIHISFKEIQKEFERCDDSLIYNYIENKYAKDVKKIFYRIKNNLQRKVKLEKINSIKTIYDK
jgi:predicted metal-dependent hydrolase